MNILLNIVCHFDYSISWFFFQYTFNHFSNAFFIMVLYEFFLTRWSINVSHTSTNVVTLKLQYIFFVIKLSNSVNLLILRYVHFLESRKISKMLVDIFNSLLIGNWRKADALSTTDCRFESRNSLDIQIFTFKIETFGWSQNW